MGWGLPQNKLGVDWLLLPRQCRPQVCVCVCVCLCVCEEKVFPAATSLVPKEPQLKQTLFLERAFLSCLYLKRRVLRDSFALRKGGAKNSCRWPGNVEIEFIFVGKRGRAKAPCCCSHKSSLLTFVVLQKPDLTEQCVEKKWTGKKRRKGQENEKNKCWERKRKFKHSIKDKLALCTTPTSLTPPLLPPSYLISAGGTSWFVSHTASVWPLRVMSLECKLGRKHAPPFRRPWTGTCGWNTTSRASGCERAPSQTALFNS